MTSLSDFIEYTIMKIIIVGAGRAGLQIAKQLIAENKDVVLIEKDPERAKYASNNLDCMVINGSGNDISVLKNADIEKANFFISLTASDEVNMINCGVAENKFKVPYKIARVQQMHYFKTNILEKPFFGIDFIVNPKMEAANKIINSIEYGVASDIIFFKHSDIQMRDIIIQKGSILKNRRVRDVRKLIDVNFLIAGIIRDEKFIVPSGETVIKENEKIYVLAPKENLEKVLDRINPSRIKIKKIVIVGGGKIGQYIAGHFAQGEKSKSKIFRNFFYLFSKKDKYSIKIIEKDYNKCKELVKLIPKHLVVNADISDESIFLEENLTEYDLIITTTGNQELNILTSVFAKKMGIKKTISIVNNVNYINMATRLGLDVIVSPKNSIINPVLKLIRKGNIQGIYTISDGEIEIMELSVKENTRITGKKIKDIKWHEHSLVLYVTRGKEHIIQDGEFVLKKDDHIILMTKEEAIQKIEKMVSEK